MSKILWCFTGSIASKLAKKIDHRLMELTDYNTSKFVYASTKSAYQFFDPSTLCNKVFDDGDEIDIWNKDNKILHIEITNDVDYIVVAPCSANTLAKIANGLCDNLVTSCVRAAKPNTTIILAPAMNTRMWEHPSTLNNIETIKSFGYIVVPPCVKTLACGDYGVGAMCEIEDITKHIKYLMMMQ